MFNFGFFALLIKLSWRSIWSHRIKSMVVGCIVFIGVFLLVLSDAMLSSINLAMEKSLTWSITGHLQMYDSKARDKLSMLGMAGSLGADPNVGRIENFAKVRKVIETHPNVKHILPMGTNYGLVFRGNVIDKLVTQLREAKKNSDTHAFQLTEQKLNQVVAKMVEQHSYRIGIVRDSSKFEEESKELQKVTAADFWNNFHKSSEAEQEDILMHLETRIAPLVRDTEPMFLQLLASDVDHFAEAFPYFKMVHGEMIPKGGRGLLINQEQYDLLFKDGMARLFDRIAFETSVKDNGPIAKNVELLAEIKRRKYEVDEWILDLGAQEAEKMHLILSDYLKKDAELAVLVAEFIDLNDGNFWERKAFFEKNLVSLIDLYPIKVGEMLTINKFGDGASIRLRFYGTYTFEGLKHSGFSGFYNLIDMTSFRDMHGFYTSEQLQEIAELKSKAGVEQVDSDSLVDNLFGEDSSIEMTGELKAADAAFNAIEEIQVIDIEQRMQDMESERYSQEEIENGPSLSAAIILRDRSKIKQTTKELEKMIADNNLELQVIDWQEAAGFIGQMITVMQVVLYTFIVFVFCVATVIINNAMFMATIQRFTEIGTLRAIGASRSVIMGMFLCESILLALIAGGLGLLAASGLLIYLGDVGILAPKPEVHFAFGGERLYPQIGWENIYLGLAVVFVVSVGATLYPAIYATKIPPIVAMSAKE